MPELRCPCDPRRRFLQRTLLVLPACMVLPAWAGAVAAGQRRLYLVNTHTGEVMDLAYWQDGSYLPEGLGMLDWLLRDHRSGAVLPMDQGLFDLLHALAAAAGVPPHYEVISGYRSPATNSMLAATTDGVSSGSLHMEGRAIDVRLRGLPTIALRDLALARQAGGVGYYPASDFVHLDLGRVRQWSG